MTDLSDALDEILVEVTTRYRLSEDNLLFLTIFRRSSPAGAEPVVVTNDQGLIRSEALPPEQRFLFSEEIDCGAYLELVRSDRDEGSGHGE